MRDKDLYAQILGIQDPWYVEDVDLRQEEGEVIVHLGRSAKARWKCQTCAEERPGYDARERRWRHLDTCQFKTILVAQVPRVECSEHGVVTVEVPWAEPGSGFTALFEVLVIDWLQEASTSAVSRMMQLSWDAVDGIMQRAVTRGLARREQQEIRRVGVDETSFQKRHEYVTIVSNHDGGKVLYVADDRKQESLDGFFETLSPDQKEQIEVVSMDMWPAYIGSTRKHIEDADSKICFDKFHVAKALGNAVDQVRRNEHKQLIQEGYTDLTRTKYLWLRNPDNMSRTQWRSFHALRTSSLKTARAWAIKEAAMSLWGYTRRGWASRSRLEPVKRVARMVRTHLWGIINAIILRADSGLSESVNAKIQKIKARACGFRNRARFRNAIYFHCGGLDLYPAGAGSSSS